MQLDPDAAPAQRRGGGNRVEGERHRAAGVVNRQRPASGLVVDDDQLAVAVIEPVDAAGERQPVGSRGDRALDAERIAAGIEGCDVALYERAAALEPGAGLGGIAKSLGRPPGVEQVPRRSRRCAAIAAAATTRPAQRAC